MSVFLKTQHSLSNRLQFSFPEGKESKLIFFKWYCELKQTNRVRTCKAGFQMQIYLMAAAHAFFLPHYYVRKCMSNKVRKRKWRNNTYLLTLRETDLNILYVRSHIPRRAVNVWSGTPMLYHVWHVRAFGLYMLYISWHKYVHMLPHLSITYRTLQNFSVK